MHFILILVALLTGGGEASEPDDGLPQEVAAPAEVSGGAAPALEPEPQEPTGRFTTATEVRPILEATRGNWVAVREYDGRDLVYFTHLLSWRCGLVQLDYGINGGAMETFPMPACHDDLATPNALTGDDVLPYVGFPLGSVQSVEVRITYDDLATDQAAFDRRGVMIP